MAEENEDIGEFFVLPESEDGEILSEADDEVEPQQDIPIENELPVLFYEARKQKGGKVGKNRKKTEKTGRKLMLNFFDYTFRYIEKKTEKDIYYCSKHTCRGKVSWNERTSTFHVLQDHNHGQTMFWEDLEIQGLKVNCNAW